MRFERVSPQAGLEPVTARNEGEHSQKEISSQTDYTQTFFLQKHTFLQDNLTKY